METNVIWLGFVGSLLAGLGTGAGALAIFLVRRLSERTENILLSSAAGVMLAATFFSLLLPAISYGEILHESKGRASLPLSWSLSAAWPEALPFPLRNR